MSAERLLLNLAAFGATLRVSCKRFVGWPPKLSSRTASAVFEGYDPSGTSVAADGLLFSQTDLPTLSSLGRRDLLTKASSRGSGGKGGYCGCLKCEYSSLRKFSVYSFDSPPGGELR